MDAFELLKADHRKVADLFDQMEAAAGQAMLNVFNQIKNELELHTHVEERIFYPALERPEETHDLTLEAYEEHKMVKTLLAELADSKSADDEWQAKAKVLRENVEHHVEEEEGALFDKAGDALSDEEIEDLGARMEAEKAAKQGRPAARRATTAGRGNRQAKSAKPGVLSRLAGLVGLGKEGSTKRRPAKKTAAKKKAPARKQTTSKSAAARKAGKKGAASRASSKRGQKSRGATATKRASAGQGMKRMPARSSGSRGRTGTAAKSAKKTSKKNTRRG